MVYNDQFDYDGCESIVFICVKLIFLYIFYARIYVMIIQNKSKHVHRQLFCPNHIKRFGQVFLFLDFSIKLLKTVPVK